jgi:hypothetical protein
MLIGTQVLQIFALLILYNRKLKKINYVTDL